MIKRIFQINLVIYFLLALAIFWISNVNAQGQGTSGAQFLQIPVGARPSALGGAYAGEAERAVTLHFNPAGLGKLKQSEINALHLQFLGGASYNYLSYGSPIGRRWGWATSLILLNVEDAVRTEQETLSRFTNSDLALTAGLGFKLTDRLSLGLSAKFIRQTLFQTSAVTEAFDVGIHYQTPLPGLRLGVSVLNIGKGIRFISVRDPLPRTVRVGFSERFLKERLRILGDAIFPRNESARGGLGVEYRVLKPITLRGGLRINADGNNQNRPTAGVGLRFGPVDISYAFVPFGLAGNTHRIEAGFLFGGRNDTAVKIRGPFRFPKTSPFHGTVNFKYGNIHTDNSGIIGFPGGPSEEIQLTTLGRVKKQEIAIRARVFRNPWDNEEIPEITGNIKGKKHEVSFGDILGRQSRYTVMNRIFRGAQGSYEMKRPSQGKQIPGELFLGNFQPDFPHLLQEIEPSQKFRNFHITAFGGQFAKPINVGEPLIGANGDLATFGVFRQFGYGFKVESDPTPLTKLNVSFSHLVDDPNSIINAGLSVKPLSNQVGSIEGKWRGERGIWSAYGELAFARFDEDQNSKLDRLRHGFASYVRMERNRGRFFHSIEIERIDPEFEDIGNLSIRSIEDREGVTLNDRYQGQHFSYSSFVHAFQNNLKDRLDFTTQTLDVRQNFRLNTVPFSWFPKFGLSFQNRRDLSGVSRVSASILQRINSTNTSWTVSANKTIRKTSLSSGITTTRFNDATRFSFASKGSDFRSSNLFFTAGINEIPRLNLFVSWNKLLTAYLENRTFFRSQGFNANAIFTAIPRKWIITARANLNRNQASTQTNLRRTFSLEHRVYLSTKTSFSVSTSFDDDHYTPKTPELEFKATKLRVTLTKVF